MSKKVEEKLLEKKTTLENVRDFFNIGKIKRVFRLGTEIFNAVTPFVEKQTPVNAVKAAFLVGKVIVEDLEVWPDDYFEEWEMPFTGDFNKIIHKALHGKPYKTIKTSEESSIIHVVDLHGVKFGYVYNTRSDSIGSIYVEPKDLKKAKELIKKELWDMLKDNNIVLKHVKKAAEKDGYVHLGVDDAFCPMPSKRADEYAVYLKKCINAGVHRSVMLYGPPGTGKSTMARTIIDNLKMKSFRIRVEDIGHIDSSTVFEAIEVFEPDAVILDDFDRSGEQNSLLETLEYFQRHVKLVVATVNNKNRLDDAILRPGRFDELVQIKQMDDDVVKAVLGNEHIKYYATVKDWPIAFIQEYVKRIRFMSPEDAEESIKELANRVQRLSKYDDEEEENVTSLLGKKHKAQGDFSDMLNENIPSLRQGVKAYKKLKRKKNIFGF